MPAMTPPANLASEALVSGSVSLNFWLVSMLKATTCADAEPVSS